MQEYVLKNQKLLRRGITTGTCCAAAADGAAAWLLLGIKKETAVIHTPKGVDVTVPVKVSESEPEWNAGFVPGEEPEWNAGFVPGEEPEWSAGFAPGEETRGQKPEPAGTSGKGAWCCVTKDSGDDPDVTNGAEIWVSVEFVENLKAEGGEARKQSADVSWRGRAFASDRYPNLYLDGGIGVGRVTKAGLEQEIGQAAINVVPRRMIFEAVGSICELAGCRKPLLIRVAVPLGAELAKKTFNPRLGIMGGISILGTSGILEPMSEKAIVDTIETEIRQRSRLGERTLLVTPGNYGQAYLNRYLHLDLEKSIKCSNYIGETLDLAAGYGMERVLLVGNIGKLVKLAAGIMNTHSRTADGRAEIFAVHTVLCGGNTQMAEQMMGCINTDEMLDLLTEWGLREPVLKSICQKIEEHTERRCGPGMVCGVVLFSEKYGYLGQTKEAERILEEC
ncbi:MAG: cobalt-precorrin-5B (C(1))-methyltransferase CbiD [Lachnospiraceae bacterium]|nr:cobalt-precorrin-5B (C(1))-methyltransferase CbiD [Lachnospiraceae bacterium]